VDRHSVASVAPDARHPAPEFILARFHALAHCVPMRLVHSVAASAALILSSVHAFAQAPVAPAPSASESAAPPAPAPEFKAPEVDDAYLKTVPEARVRIRSWDDALGWLRSRSTDLRIAMLEVVRAEAQTRVALAGALPTITGTANITENLIRNTQSYTDYSPLFSTPPGQPVSRSVTIPVATTYGGAITLTQPVLALRAWHAMGTTEALKEAARLSVEDRKRTIALAAASAVIGVVTAERVAEVNRVGLRASLERLQLTRRRAALGASNALDVLRAEQDAAQARSAIVQGDDALLRAREGLGLALGASHPVGVTRDISLDDIEVTARRTCAAAPNVDARADIRAARKQVDIGDRNVKDVWLQFAPTVNLVSRTDLYSEQLANNRHVAWSIAGVLTVPFWEGGARYGLLRDATAQRDEARVRLEAVRRGALIDVEQARRTVSVAENQLAVATQTRDLAKQQERLARLSFEMGKATSFELVDAGRGLRSAEINLAVAEFNVVEARIAAWLALAECTW
jgi:outer membrane protein TolC